jgi:parvulin-like peptidyl-prolyl isomerase
VPTERRAAEVKREIVKDLVPLQPREPVDVGPNQPEAPKDPLLRTTEFAAADAEKISLAFAAAALSYSTDPTAARGGLLTAISPSDQGLPTSVRKALAQMHPREVSGVLTTDRGAMLVLMESLGEAEGSPAPQDRAKAEARVRFRKERIAMDRLAHQLLGTASVSPMDGSLRWSWETRVK